MKENGYTLAKAISRRYPARTIMDADYADHITLLVNKPAQAESLFHILEQAAGDRGLHVNVDKTEFMCFNQGGDISSLNGRSLKLADKFILPGISTASTENGINTWLAKTWIVINKLSVIWKSELLDKIKRIFFQAAVVSMMLCGCTTWTLAICMERKLYGYCTRIRRAILKKSWRQYPKKYQLYAHLPPISKAIQTRQAKYAGAGRRSKGELISDVHLQTHSHGRAMVGWLVRTYLQQFCTNTGCSMENLPRPMDDRDEWQERVRETRASDTPWYIYIYSL